MRTQTAHKILLSSIAFMLFSGAANAALVRFDYTGQDFEQKNSIGDTTGLSSDFNNVTVSMTFDFYDWNTWLNTPTGYIGVANSYIYDVPHKVDFVSGRINSGAYSIELRPEGYYQYPSMQFYGVEYNTILTNGIFGLYDGQIKEWRLEAKASKDADFSNIPLVINTNGHPAGIGTDYMTAGLINDQDNFVSGGSRYQGTWTTTVLDPISPSPVPLPAAFPLMLSGLGVLGFAARRRKLVL